MRRYLEMWFFWIIFVSFAIKLVLIPEHYLHVLMHPCSRCKLFYKKGTEFADKGLGMLHLKPVDGSKKTQLLVRAETSLGNILLNIMLNKQVLSCLLVL